MTKNNKNKGKNPKPIPLTKYTNMLVGKEKKKSFTDVVEFYKRTGLLPVMNDSSVEKAVKWYLYDLRNNKDNSISKEKEKQTKSLAKRYSKDRKTKATESELLILSEINKIGLSNIGQVKSRLDEDEVKILNITEMSSITQSDETSKGGNPNMAFVNEAGMYDVIVRSDSPKAKPFRKWVCSEVLPSIRKHGAYMTAETIEEALKNPDIIIKIATELKTEQEARKKLQAEAKENEPKVKFANALMSSESSILVNQMASILTQNGHKIGQNRLFEWLRKNDYLHENTENRNLPKQKWIEKGYFEIKTSVYFDNKAMALKTKSTPKITMKGVEHILSVFDNERVTQVVEQF